MIGVFDSGFGGLTVLGELARQLPQYDYLYVGDSARCPYGMRSADAVHEFTREAIEYLFDEGCPLVILACNTASARALRTLQTRHLPRFRPDRRVLGVVRPTVEALAQLPPGAVPGQTAPPADEGTVAVLGTPGTIESGSYRIELEKLAPRLRLIEKACPLWVPLVETGELGGAGTEFFVHKYLDPLFAPGAGAPAALALACTHYPLLQEPIRAAVPAGVRIISQGEIVAGGLRDWLRRHPDMEARLSREGRRRYVTTDDPIWFAARGSAILQPVLGLNAGAITVEKVRLQPFRGAA